jgi:hypothetical protein
VFAVAVAALLLLATVLATFLLRRGGSPWSPDAKPRVSTGGLASNVAEANEYFEKGMFFMKF